jgi:catechol 2,3-dioxygenase-like lactoylglutathione lyase family enzyme
MKFAMCLGIALTLMIGRVSAQGVSAAAMGFDNMHILSPSPAETRAWYMANLGAAPSPTLSMAYLGKTLLVFLKNDKAQPTTGSSIDHLAISVADVDATLAKLQSAGAKLLEAAADAPGPFRAGFVQDPWGVKIEVLRDPDVVGLHHLHLRVLNPQTTLTWFEQMMGGERAKLKGRIDGIRYGAMWLLAAGSGGAPTAPSADRAIQHIAWRVSDIDAARTTLIGRGLTVGAARPYEDVRFAILESPSGVRVEIIQRPQ